MATTTNKVSMERGTQCGSSWKCLTSDGDRDVASAPDAMQVRSRAASEEGVEFLRGNDRQPSPIIFLLLCMPRVCVSVFDSVKWASAMEEASVASTLSCSWRHYYFVPLDVGGHALLYALCLYILYLCSCHVNFSNVLHNHCVTAGTFIQEHNNSLPGLIRYSGDTLRLFHICVPLGFLLCNKYTE